MSKKHRTTAKFSEFFNRKHETQHSFAVCYNKMQREKLSLISEHL